MKLPQLSLRQLLLLTSVVAAALGLWVVRGRSLDDAAGALTLSVILLPFLTVLRWNGAGFWLAVFYGWGSIHVASRICTHTDHVDAVFVGVWVAIGWAFMIVWCAVAAAISGAILGIRWLIGRVGQPSVETHP